MGDHDHRAGPAVEQVLELAQRVDVQVVGRLVQQQHIRLCHEHTRELQPTPLAAGQVADGSALTCRREAEPLGQLGGGQLVVAERHPRGHVLDRLEHPLVERQIVEFLLEPADPDGLALLAPTGRQRRLTGERPQQGGLTGAVDAHQADALAGGQPPGQVVDQGAAVGGVEPDVLELDHHLAQAPGRKARQRN